jgi:hypothetical protein
VPDSYCEYKSSHVFSSDESEDEDDEIKPKMQILKGVEKWSFTIQN